MSVSDPCKFRPRARLPQWCAEKVDAEHINLKTEVPSGLPAFLEIFVVPKKPRNRRGLWCSGDRALVHLHRIELKERKDSGSSREGAGGARRAF